MNSPYQLNSKSRKSSPKRIRESPSYTSLDKDLGLEIAIS
jgi:hypothetical protein